MNDEPHTGLSTCICLECTMIRCGALSADWHAWSWVTFAGQARVIMYQITGQPPVRWVGPRTLWAGVTDWFRWTGHALNFDEEDDDAPA
jgi:hypothetical protein